MGIKDRLKNIWAIQPEGEPLGEVLTGGNQFSVKREFEARFRNMLNSIDLSNDNLDRVVYDEYFLMLFQKNYFVNLFDIETDDADFRKAWNIFVELCFWYGEAALVNLGIEGMDDTTKLAPVYIKDKKINYIGDIEKDFEYYLGAHIIPMLGESSMWKSKIEPNLKAFKNKGDFVYSKWNTQAYGAWVWLYKFITLQKELMYLAHGSAYLQKETLFYKINNVDTIEDEVKVLYNPKINIIPSVGISWDNNDTRIENRWMTDKLSHDSTMTINEVYDWTVDKYYELFGRKHNVDFKKERNVSGEVEASQEQFDVLINETKKYFEMALKECEEKFKKKGELKIDVLSKETENNNKNNNIENDGETSNNFKQ